MIDRQTIIRRAAETGWGAVRLAREFGVSAPHVTRILRRARLHNELPDRPPGSNRPRCPAMPGTPAPPPEPAHTGTNWTDNTGPEGRTITLQSDTIRTVEGALEAAQVDLTKWQVADASVRKWDVTMKGEPPLTVENWYIAVKLKPIAPDPIAKAIEAYTARIPTRRPIPLPPPREESAKTLEIALYDHHFQMLAWHAENNGFDYDLNIAARLFRRAVREQIAAAAPHGIGNVLFPIGNDFFHTNNPEAVTPRSGNALDTDGRLAKAFMVGLEAAEQAVEDLLRAFGSVDLLWIPGNHDPETGFFLCHVLRQRFRDCPGVTVDVSPTFRKYRTIGRNLIGFTHGVDEKAADLPLIMATECPQEWAQARHREWHVGHFHKRRETRYNAGETFGGVSVRVLPSLAAADHWHYRKGYVTPEHTSDAFVWCPETGLRAILTTSADKSQYSQKEA